MSEKAGLPGLSELRQHQQLLLQLLSAVPGEDINRQFHQELSPLGWHLGHCVYTESYWIREVVLGQPALDEELSQLYIPELSEKNLRGTALPETDQLYDWARQCQAENLELLDGAMRQGSDNKLMQDNYLPFFLCQHYAQHIETASYVIAQCRLQKHAGIEVQNPLEASSLACSFSELSGGYFQIGRADPLRHYDNECGEFEIELDDFAIAERPVSNAEFLGFIENGGYEREELWQDNSWAWRCEQDISLPQHWRRDQDGQVYGNDAEGPYELRASAPVAGISLLEAQAFASWADASLPHEYQWEVAKKAGQINDTGEVWEWCNNPLHPYPGFAAFPYDGYSLPWFDDRHFSLRGHSSYTLPVVQRDSFRNFYQVDKRHFPAGLRLLA